MTPKDKAYELVSRFIIYTNLFNPDNPNNNGWEKDIDSAKQCALVAVDEVIKSREDDSGFDDSLSFTGSQYYTPHPMYLVYWLQTKQKIENL